jgi:methyl-accepting chemotaxis protein
MRNSMSIKARLAGLVAIAGVALAILCGYGLHQVYSLTAQMNESFDELLNVQAMVSDTSKAQVAFKGQVQEWKDTLLRGNDKANYEKYTQQFGEREQAVDAALDMARTHMRTAGLDTKPAEDALEEHKSLGARYRKALESFDAADPNTGKKVDAAVKGMDRPLAAAMSKLTEVVESTAKTRSSERIARAQAVASSTTFMLLGGAVALLLIMLGCGYWIASSILQPLAQLERTARDVEQNWNLSARAELDTDDEIGRCGHAMDAMLKRFQAVVGGINSQSSQVAVQTEAIASALEELGSTSNNQNDATTSVSAAIEELTVSIGQVEDAAREARALAQKSQLAATTGRSAVEDSARRLDEITRRVQQTVLALEELGKRSNSISGIVQTVKEIADQTNLLALNAAIEAARAGEQGRGFAVVADEVRKLAEKTTGSTDEISSLTALIQESSAEAITSVRALSDDFQDQLTTAQRADAAIIDIQQNIDAVNNVASTISDALREQSSASQLISQQVDRIARMAEESHQALSGVSRNSQNLDASSQQLRGSVSTFKV